MHQLLCTYIYISDSFYLTVYAYTSYIIIIVTGVVYCNVVMDFVSATVVTRRVVHFKLSVIKEKAPYSRLHGLCDFFYFLFIILFMFYVNLFLPTSGFKSRLKIKRLGHVDCCGECIGLEMRGASVLLFPTRANKIVSFECILFFQGTLETLFPYLLSMVV